MKQSSKIWFFGVLITLMMSGCGGSSDGSSGSGNPGTGQQDPGDGPVINPNPKAWSLSDNLPPKYTLTTAGQVSDFSKIVYGKHPRLFFRDTDVAGLRARMNTRDWIIFKDVLTTAARLPKTKSVQDSVAYVTDSYTAENTEYPEMLLFLTFMEKDAHYIAVTRAWMQNLANPARVLETSDGDILLRNRIERLAQMYDWLHDLWTPQERKMIRTALMRHITRLMSFDYMTTTTNYIQKHSRRGHAVLGEALLATYGDFDADFTKEYADGLLNTTREALRKYYDAESYIAKDGGWHLGWMYAYYYGGFTSNYLAWSTATKETMLGDWMGEMADWYIYALRRNYTLPLIGDTAINPMELGILSTLYQAKYQKNPVAKWYVEEVKNRYYNDLVMRFILADDTVVKKTPAQANLPLSRYFKHAGTVIARDTWALNQSTMLIFKSSPFYNAGHHHRDENSFTIDYKTSLALDTGFYDETDSEHYKNYYVRTIAHNAVTVYNPSQKMYYFTDYNTKESLADKRLPNDGGQIYKNPDSMSKEDILPGKRNALGGITRYQSNASYTYMKGDASKAYDPLTVSLEKRDVVYVKDAGEAHPVVIVLDKIEATNGNFQKRYLLHMESNAQPTIAGNIMRVTSQGAGSNAAKMTNITLYPTNASKLMIGGNGNEFPLIPGETGVTTPRNVPIVTDIKGDKEFKTGNWRLEVLPQQGKKYDVMLNVIFVDDVSAANVSSQNARLIDSVSSVGVQLKNRIFVFSKDKEDAAIAQEYKVAQNANIAHTVATGFAAGESVKVSLNGSVVQTVTVGKGGCVDFTLNASTADTIRIAK